MIRLSDANKNASPAWAKAHRRARDVRYRVDKKRAGRGVAKAIIDALAD